MTATDRRPRASAAFAAVFRLVLGEIVTRARLAAVVGLGGLAIVISFVISRNSDDLVEDGARLVASLGMAVVVPIVALLFASAALGDLREDKTLVYLWLTPARRWIVPLAALCASALVVVPAVVVPVSIAAAVITTENGLLSGTIAATTLAALAYTSVFVMLGLLTRRTLVWGVAYILIWEGFVASGGAGAARLALRAHGVSILSDATEVDLNLGDLNPSTAVAVLATTTLTAIAVAIWRYSTMTVD